MAFPFWNPCFFRGSMWNCESCVPSLQPVVSHRADKLSETTTVFSSRAKELVVSTSIVNNTTEAETHGIMDTATHLALEDGNEA